MTISLFDALAAPRICGASADFPLPELRSLDKIRVLANTLEQEDVLDTSMVDPRLGPQFFELPPRPITWTLLPSVATWLLTPPCVESLHAWMQGECWFDPKGFISSSSYISSAVAEYTAVSASLFRHFLWLHIHLD